MFFFALRRSSSACHCVSLCTFAGRCCSVSPAPCHWKGEQRTRVAWHWRIRTAPRWSATPARVRACLRCCVFRDDSRKIPTQHSCGWGPKTPQFPLCAPLNLWNTLCACCCISFAWHLAVTTHGRDPKRHRGPAYDDDEPHHSVIPSTERPVGRLRSRRLALRKYALYPPHHSPAPASSSALPAAVYCRLSQPPLDTNTAESMLCWQIRCAPVGSA